MVLRGILLVLGAFALAATACYLFSQELAPAVERGTFEEGDVRVQASDPLQGSPARRDGSGDEGSRPDAGSQPARPIPRITAEDLAQETFESIKNTDTDVAVRLDRVRHYITQATGFLPAEEVAYRLTDLLEPNLDPSEDGSFRGGLLAAYKGLAARVVVPTLLASVTDPRPKVRLGALTALEDFRKEEAVRKRFEAVLRDPDTEVRAKARALLTRPVSDDGTDPAENGR